MNDQLQMFREATLLDSPNATSSPASVLGPTLSGKPDGKTHGQSGPEAAPAPVSALQAKGEGLQTLVTSGLNGYASSESAALESSLVSRLMERLDTDGSTLFQEIWKRKATPLRRRYWAHTARGLRTSGSDCTSVPTPCANQANGEPEAFLDRKRKAVENGSQMGIFLSDLNMVSKLASVPTPQARLNGGGDYTDPEKAIQRKSQGHQINLSDTATLSAVPTPQTHDDKLRGNTEADGHYSAHDLSNASILAAVPSPCTPNGGRSCSTDKMDATGRTLDGRKHTASLEHAVKFSTVATPRTEDSQCAGAHRGTADTLHSQANLSAVSTPRRNENDQGNQDAIAEAGSSWLGQGRGATLSTEAKLASISTPSVRDRKDTSGMSESGVDLDGSTRSRLDQLPRQAQLADSGQTAIGGTGEMANTGQLDPAYSRWLQGLPPEWCDCAVTAIASQSPSPKRSSKRTSKAKANDR